MNPRTLTVVSSGGAVGGFYLIFLFFSVSSKLFSMTMCYFHNHKNGACFSFNFPFMGMKRFGVQLSVLSQGPPRTS